MLPKITIITPSYNQGKYIGSTVRSVLNQGYPHLEFLVLDGGSTDETLSVLHSFDSKLAWISKKDKGQVDAINQGIEQASGEVIGYLNSDDLLAPGALWKVGRFFANNTQKIWLTGDYAIISSESQKVNQEIRIYKHLQRTVAAVFPQLWPTVLSLNNPIAQPSTFWRRSVHKKVGYFDEKYHYVMDYDFWLRLLRLQLPSVSSEVLSFFRVHGSSKGGKHYRQQFAQQLECARNYGFSSRALTAQSLLNELVCRVYSRR